MSYQFMNIVTFANLPHSDDLEQKPIKISEVYKTMKY